MLAETHLLSCSGTWKGIVMSAMSGQGILTWVVSWATWKKFVILFACCSLC